MRDRRTLRSTTRGSWAWALCGVALLGAPGLAQQSTLDPYKPDTRRYQAFADPGAAFRPGFPNPLGNGQRNLYGQLDPSENGYGGFDPFAPPYYNRFSSSLNRAGAAYGRAAGALSRQPSTGPMDPQALLDQKFYEEQQSREDPYLKLQHKKEELYFKALMEQDPKKRAELMKEYQRATQKSAQALAAPRRDLGITPRKPAASRGAAASGRGQPLTKPRTGPAGEDPSLGDAIDRSERQDRELGLDPLKPPTSGTGTRRLPSRR